MVTGVDFASFSDVLKHPIRRRIILALYSRSGLTYMDLLNAAEVANTGKFNYHLKLLSDLIDKDSGGKYVLTEKGLLAAQFLLKFPEKKAEPSHLSIPDASLIALAGFVLTASNPALWLALWAGAAKLNFSLSVLMLFPTNYLIYGLFVPSGVMWRLTVKRTSSHDMYTLLRAPLVLLVVLASVLVIMLLLKIDLVAEIKTPVVHISQYASSQTWIGFSLAIIFLQGLIFSFLGVSAFELASRVRRKLRF